MKTTKIEDLKKWLSATNLTVEQQNDFVARFQVEGKWTPELAEEFAGAVSSSLKGKIADIEKYTKELKTSNSNNKLKKIDDQVIAEYRELAKKELDNFKKEAEQGQKLVDDAKASYENDKLVNARETIDDMTL